MQLTFNAQFSVNGQRHNLAWR